MLVVLASLASAVACSSSAAVNPAGGDASTTLGGTLVVPNIQPPTSETTTAPPVATEPASRGIPAKEVATEVAFSLTVAPSEAKPGDVVTTTFSGDLSGRWLAGSYALIDEETAGEWRSIWALIETGIPAPPQSLAAPGSMYNFPANGYPPAQPLMFQLPDELETGTYRLCRELHEGIPDPRSAYVCAPISIRPAG
jgi:hypothetical protein